MKSRIQFFFSVPNRFAFPAKAKLLRALIPPKTMGTYLLLWGPHPIYVGRSDHCLKERLAGHEHLSDATHIVWEPFQSSLRAFYCEAAWFHILQDQSSKYLLNRRHPAIPYGSIKTCPFCTSELEDAFKYAITNL